jgi:hypothetical protein
MQKMPPNLIDIVTIVREPDGMELLVSEPIPWDPDREELAQARGRAVDAAHQIAEYIRRMPVAAERDL